MTDRRTELFLRGGGLQQFRRRQPPWNIIMVLVCGLVAMSVYLAITIILLLLK